MQPNIDEIQLDFDQEALWIMNLCLAVVMFGVALNLTLEDFKTLLKRPIPTILGIVSQFVLLPAFTYLIILLFKPQPSIALGMIMVAACPGGNISNFFTHMAKGNVALSIGLTSFATIVAIFMTPFNLHFWGSMYGPTNEILEQISLNPFDVFKTVALILLVPLVIGMMLRYRYPKNAIYLSEKLKLISIIIFITIVIIAFSKNINIFLAVIHVVIGIVFVHNAVAIATGFSLGVLFKLPFEDRKTLAIETGIQNSGLGLILIFTFFDQLGGMAIVAGWWGIWHIITGLSMGFIWGRKK